MSDRTIKLLLVEPDPIFRIGFSRLLNESYTDIQIIAEAETGASARKILADFARENATAFSSGLPSDTVNLVVLELQLGLELCQQLKSHYPDLPILILSSLQEPALLASVKAVGIEGYCPKGTSIVEIVTAIRQVASKRNYWIEAESLKTPLAAPSILALVRNHLRWTGLQQIDTTLAAVTARLQVPGLPLLDRAFLAGQRRELLASRWLVTHLLPLPESKSRSTTTEDAARLRVEENTTQLFQAQTTQEAELSSQTNVPSGSLVRLDTNLSRLGMNEILMVTSEKLESNLQNLTTLTLETDIFREGKKRELFKIILQKVVEVLEDLRFAQVQSHQLGEMQYLILRDLWQGATVDFFGRYAVLEVGDRNLEIVNLLLQDVETVQFEILNKIPLVSDLFAYLLFQTPLAIDNFPYQADTPEAKARAEIILHNLLVHVANAVAQPLLNRLADVEIIKQNFYDSRLISTREIERFRNNLSWKYRWQKYYVEPKAIFESRYELFLFIGRGIVKTSVYAPRAQELQQLSGIPQLVTLALELRDAIAPRFRAVIAFLGSGVVYVLTQVIGRAIGLVGRGILQGIGSSTLVGRKKKF
jgi:DNA-binding NarL/FixJ family response regulator